MTIQESNQAGRSIRSLAICLTPVTAGFFRYAVGAYSYADHFYDCFGSAFERRLLDGRLVSDAGGFPGWWIARITLMRRPVHLSSASTHIAPIITAKTAKNPGAYDPVMAIAAAIPEAGNILASFRTG